MRAMPRHESLTPELLVRACQHAGLDAALIALPFEQVCRHHAALILELDSDALSVAVMEPSQRSESGGFTVYDKQGQELTQTPPREDLASLYSGRSIVLQISPSSERPSSKQESVPFSVWLRQLLKGHRPVVRDVLVATLLINLFALATPLFTMNVYDRVVPNQAIETLWVLAAGVALVMLFDLVLKLVRQHLIDAVGHRLDLALSTKLMQHVMATKMQHLPSSVGNLANQFREFEGLRQLFNAGSLMMLVDLPFAAIFLLLIYSIGGALVWVPLIMASILMVYGLLNHWRLRSVSQSIHSENNEKYAVLVETMAALETLKAFNAQGRAQGLWEQSVARVAEYYRHSRQLVDRLSMGGQFVTQLAVVLTLIVGVYQLQDQVMSLGGLIACVLLTSRALAPMLQVSHLTAQLWQARQAVAGLNQLCALPSEHADRQRPVHHDYWRGEIQFRDLEFAYEPNKAVLKSLNVSISPGEHVALIGRVGSGKSSLFKLLLQLAEAERGQVCIDGIDVRHLDATELRQAIAYVPQEVRLFRGTLRDNLALKHAQASDAEILFAARQAGLEGLIRSHSLGLDMPIGEAGHGLSGGQKQGVAIARALLGDPAILLFDELTSAMDNQSEQEVIAAIKAYSQGKTLILSTHRSALLALVDRIIVLDEGRVVADGAKDKVLDALKKGLINSARKPGGTNE